MREQANTCTQYCLKMIDVSKSLAFSEQKASKYIFIGIALRVLDGIGLNLHVDHRHRFR